MNEPEKITVVHQRICELEQLQEELNHALMWLYSSLADDGESSDIVKQAPLQ